MGLMTQGSNQATEKLAKYDAKLSSYLYLDNYVGNSCSFFVSTTCQASDSRSYRMPEQEKSIVGDDGSHKTPTQIPARPSPDENMTFIPHTPPLRIKYMVTRSGLRLPRDEAPS